jgi:DNA-directed RNA polymerase specialized sigma24 family protein
MSEIENVMAKYAAGDDMQLGTLYDLAAPPLFAFLTRMARDRALAEDLTHDAFLRVHSARATYREGARVMPWMYVPHIVIGHVLPCVPLAIAGALLCDRLLRS